MSRLLDVTSSAKANATKFGKATVVIFRHTLQEYQWRFALDVISRPENYECEICAFVDADGTLAVRTGWREIYRQTDGFGEAFSEACKQVDDDELAMIALSIADAADHGHIVHALTRPEHVFDAFCREVLEKAI